ncbi:hypothetical protein K1T73_07975 [Roseovarius sp. SCSIO 43702]|uniref:hypothetical protein n=1 Tax=Roseovarius sp. SCSIO 43702 TaxID=2823043 RepID=UPI001C7335E7|nr:hypothetical protein [Roseovarius sp. SCSIO 43702]QYX58286.1 hypothetical protein K1T73_07975 [Roseovarius sp. SCSIO 43702]
MSKSTAEDVKAEAKSAKDDLTKAARDAAKDAKHGIQEEARRRAEGAKEGVADEVQDVASGLRKAADDMRDGSPQERTIGQLASGLADISDAIRDKDLGQAANELGAFAKRNPLLFLGGAALAGFVATRFATASARRDDGDGTSHTAGEARHTAPAAPRTPATPTTQGQQPGGRS